MEARERKGVWDGRAHTAKFKMKSQQVPTAEHGKSAQRGVAAWTGGEPGGEWIHLSVWLSPSAVHLKPSQRC